LNGYQPLALDVALPAQRLGVDRHWLTRALTQSASIGALFEQIEHRQAETPIWQQRWAPVRIEQAIMDLRRLLEPLRRQRSTPALAELPVIAQGSGHRDLDDAAS
jgi:hypothetical protein